MERGIYFDGWFPNHYCYHPSMPPRRLSMIDDLEDMGGTILVWAGLGGGSISLPYLEEEAFGSIPARFRQYGFVNDSEFIAHAKARGIDRLFAVGPLSAAAVEAFGEGATHFDSKDALVAALQPRLHAGVTCLVKGSRSAGMDQVASALRPHTDRGGAPHAA